MARVYLINAKSITGTVRVPSMSTMHRNMFHALSFGVNFGDNTDDSVV